MEIKLRDNNLFVRLYIPVRLDKTKPHTIALSVEFRDVQAVDPKTGDGKRLWLEVYREEFPEVWMARYTASQFLPKHLVGVLYEQFCFYEKQLQSLGFNTEI